MVFVSVVGRVELLGEFGGEKAAKRPVRDAVRVFDDGTRERGRDADACGLRPHRNHDFLLRRRVKPWVWAAG